MSTIYSLPTVRMKNNKAKTLCHTKDCEGAETRRLLQSDLDLVRNRDSPGSIRLGTAKVQGQVPRSWSCNPISGILESNLAGLT